MMISQTGCYNLSETRFHKKICLHTRKKNERVPCTLSRRQYSMCAHELKGAHVYSSK